MIQNQLQTNPILPARQLEKLDPNITIAELGKLCQPAVDLLVNKYGFHCVGCFASEFETLAEGAAVHGITGPYFEEMLQEVEVLMEAK